MKKQGRLGTHLRNVRESKRLSLRDVEQQLHIRKSYLEALEQEKYSVLPNEVYLRGFLRSYARFLGLSPEKCIAYYENEKAKQVVQKQEDRNTAAASRMNKNTETTPSTENQPPRKKGCFAWMISIVCALLIVAIGVWQGPQVIKFLQYQVYKSTPGSVKVEMSTTNYVWIQVWVDGTLQAEGFLPSHSQYEFNAGNEIQILVGDGARVHLQENGIDKGQMGLPGEMSQKIIRRGE